MIRLHKHIPLLPALLVLSMMAILAGCATRPPQPMPAPQPEPEPQQPRGEVTPLPSGQRPEVTQPPQQQTPSRPRPPSGPKQVSSPAVMALLGSADTLARSGHMDRAAATLERALNIEPRNPFVYQRLAAVRLAQGQIDQAEALAHKSNSLAVGNPFVRADNWVLIAEARRMRGDQAGRREAMAKVERYRLQSASFK